MRALWTGNGRSCTLRTLTALCALGALGSGNGRSVTLGTLCASGTLSTGGTLRTLTALCASVALRAGNSRGRTGDALRTLRPGRTLRPDGAGH